MKDWDSERNDEEEISYAEEKPFPNGCKYKGTHTYPHYFPGFLNKKGQKHGPGTMRYSNGALYNGKYLW